MNASSREDSGVHRGVGAIGLSIARRVSTSSSLSPSKTWTRPCLAWARGAVVDPAEPAPRVGRTRPLVGAPRQHILELDPAKDVAPAIPRRGWGRGGRPRRAGPAH